MSFSGMVKDELSKRMSTARHCQVAELAAFYSSAGMIQYKEDGGRILVLRTENETVSRKCFTILRKTFNINTTISIRESAAGKRGKVYLIEISDESEIEEVLQAVKLTPNGESAGTLVQKNSLVTQRSCCKRAFIRGAFLSSGSIRNPERGYHFEIVCSEEEKAEHLKEMICTFEIDAKIVMRKRSYVVYVKEGAQIVDMLAIMEANVALMNLENIRILKEMRNSINRQVNCETANINKTVEAAVKQIEDIQLVEKRVGFENLNKSLAEIAELRLQYPEATLKELGMMLNPQVGKSGVNHRLKKLSMMAEKLREDKEELL